MGTVSRQRIWQLRRVAAGLCAICGKRRLEVGMYCQAHYEYNAIKSRNAYRTAHGLDADDRKVRPQKNRRAVLQAKRNAQKRLQELTA